MTNSLFMVNPVSSNHMEAPMEPDFCPGFPINVISDQTLQDGYSHLARDRHDKVGIKNIVSVLASTQIGLQSIYNVNQGVTSSGVQKKLSRKFFPIRNNFMFAIIFFNLF